MAGALYTSVHFDDPHLLAEEFAAGAAGHSEHSLGLLLCDSQIDYGKVIAELQEKLPFKIFGGTSLTFPISDENADEISASFLVISKDEMRFSTVVSAPFDASRIREQMKDVYERSLKELGEKPRLLIPFFPLVPGLPTGHFIEELFKVAGDIPVFGGTTTGDLISTHAAVFAEGNAFTDRMALIALSGINPVFSACNVVTAMSDYAPTVTESEGSVVSKVDDMSFCDYMREIGLSPEDRQNGVDALLQYGPIPVRLELPDKPDDGVPEVSCISYTMLDRGSVAFSRSVPVGTKVGVSILRKEDVEESAKQCLDNLLDEAAKEEKDGYSYDTLLCVSCVARYFVLVGGSNKERILLKNEIPERFATSGYYGFCEIGPTKNRENQDIINRAHSASIIMCAF